MICIPRWYQDEAIDKGISSFKSPKKKNDLIIIPTGAGKSLCIANIAKELTDAPKLILQPSREILIQNYEKYISYEFKASIYSASLKKKEISDTTFATIGSIYKNPSLFKDFKYVIVDEAHLVDAKKEDGMYASFFEAIKCKVLGFTASPYRLSTDGYGGSMLKFINRTRPKLFDDIAYYVNNKPLFDQGYLSPLQYFSVEGFDQFKVPTNSTGAGFDERALRAYYKSVKFPDKLIKVLKRLIEIGRRNCIIFTETLDIAEYVAGIIPGIALVTGTTPTKERDEIVKKFKAGLIWGVITVGVFITGFDYPELETVVLASPMLSLASFYQKIGRIIRPHFLKKFGMVVDMCDNMRLFGKIEDLEIRNDNGKFAVWNSTMNKPLTNVYFGR